MSTPGAREQGEAQRTKEKLTTPPTTSSSSSGTWREKARGNLPALLVSAMLAGMQMMLPPGVYGALALYAVVAIFVVFVIFDLRRFRERTVTLPWMISGWLIAGILLITGFSYYRNPPKLATIGACSVAGSPATGSARLANFKGRIIVIEPGGGTPTGDLYVGHVRWTDGNRAVEPTGQFQETKLPSDLIVARACVSHPGAVHMPGLTLSPSESCTSFCPAGVLIPKGTVMSCECRGECPKAIMDCLITGYFQPETEDEEGLRPARIKPEQKPVLRDWLSLLPSVLAPTECRVNLRYAEWNTLAEDIRDAFIGAGCSCVSVRVDSPELLSKEKVVVYADEKSVAIVTKAFRAVHFDAIGDARHGAGIDVEIPR